MAFARVGFCCDDVKPFGPVQAYVAFATAGVESAITVPSQNGPLLLAVGVAGMAVLTTTFVVPAEEAHPPTVTMTEYMPASALVVFARVGFCCEEVKPFGPVQAYVAFVTAGVVSEIVPPTQNGPPLLAVGVAGIGLTATVVLPGVEVQPLKSVTEYAPASAIVALARVGFWSVEVKPFGPVHRTVAPATVGVESTIVPPSQ